MIYLNSRSLVLVCLTLSCPVVASEVGDCAITMKERAVLLELDYRNFDQNAEDGWRPLYEGKCFADAAELIVSYISSHPEVARENYMLGFHAGQMFALDDQTERAIDFMSDAYRNRSSKIVDWNAFVDANIAFLEKDMNRLVEMRDRIGQQPALEKGPGTPDWAIGKKINLDVVNGFIACFDQPYSVAYEEACRAKGNSEFSAGADAT